MLDMSQDADCCICGEPLVAPYNAYGGRVYCAPHFALVNKPHAGMWRAGLAQIIGLVVFAVGAALLGLSSGPLSGPPMWIAGILISVVPSILWLIWFYREDQVEPEPKTRIAQVVIVAMVVYDVAGRRLIEDAFHVSEWAHVTWVSLMASVLVLGVVYQLVQYLAVRTVYASADFDERMDGIVYGTAAGLGLAALLNLRYVIDNGGVDLTAGVIRTVTTAMAQAAFGGLMGYVMAEAKFKHRPTWYVPTGFIVCAFLNGLFTWLLSEVSASGLTTEPFRSLILGGLLAAAAFGLLLVLMRRSMSVQFGRA